MERGLLWIGLHDGGRELDPERTPGYRRQKHSVRCTFEEQALRATFGQGIRVAFRCTGAGLYLTEEGSTLILANHFNEVRNILVGDYLNVSVRLQLDDPTQSLTRTLQEHRIL